MEQLWAVRCRQLDGHCPGRQQVAITRWGSSPTAPWSPWDGTTSGQCDVGGWTDIIQVADGGAHGGAEVRRHCGRRGSPEDPEQGIIDDYGQCDVGDWTDIIQVAAGSYHTVGLKSDGTVVAVGDNYDGQCDVGDWTDIIQIAAGDSHTVGLKFGPHRGRRGR